MFKMFVFYFLLFFFGGGFYISLNLFIRYFYAMKNAYYVNIYKFLPIKLIINNYL